MNSIKELHTACRNDRSMLNKIFKEIRLNKSLYIMAIPVIVYYIIFHYIPMYGAIIAFKDYSPALGILKSHWIGVEYFKDFFSSYYFFRILKNTITISVASLVFGFPAPIIFALLINELKNKLFTRVVQTISYLPHFISLVVICGMIRDFTSDTGIITSIFSLLGGQQVNMLTKPELFVPIYVSTGIWHEVGWGSIIYLAALTNIDVQLYEAAKIDGAGKWKQLLCVTLPGIVPTIVIMLILKIGNVLNVGFEKIILLYSPVVYDTSDVISTFVYRKGLQEFNWGFSSAVGLFNSVVNFILLISANWFSKKMNQSTLW